MQPSVGLCMAISYKGSDPPSAPAADLSSFKFFGACAAWVFMKQTKITQQQCLVPLKLHRATIDLPRGTVFSASSQVVAGRTAQVTRCAMLHVLGT